MKQVNDCIYAHKSARNIFDSVILDKYISYLPDNFDFTIIKYNKNTNVFSFINSPDWDTADEPIVGDSYRVYSDGTVKFLKQSNNPYIYHHKWMFVNEDYDGFDIEKSKKRSEICLKLFPNMDKTRIGRKSYWDRLTQEYNGE